MMKSEALIIEKVQPDYEENAKQTLAKIGRTMWGLPFHMQRRADSALVEAAKGSRFPLEFDAAINDKLNDYAKLEGVAGLQLSATAGDKKQAAEKLALKAGHATRNIVATFDDMDDLTGDSVALCLGTVFEHLSAICKNAGLKPASLKANPTTKEIGTACRKMRCEDWFLRQIKKEQGRALEDFSIKAQFVAKHLSKYVSPQTLADFKERRARNKSLMENLEVYNEELGILMPMLDHDDQGNEIGIFANNASNRRNEMMTRSRGLEEYLKEKGYVALFVTATAPSRFHRWRGYQPNPRYENLTPRASHQWLQTRWQRIRAEFGRDGIDFAALRTAEPHKDGCAHWHMMLYIPKEQLQLAEAIIESFFIFDDDFKDKGDDLKYRIENGLELKRINMHGDESATAYLAKYISKNIDGKGESQGESFEIEPDDNVQRVLAWASVWGIRQFQFSNGGKVGIWREVRRLVSDPKTLPDKVRKVFDAVNNTDHGAQDDASWCDYLKAMEGNPLGLDKEQDESEMYGNPIERIKGLLFGDVQIGTRVGEWVVYNKAELWTTYTPAHEKRSLISLRGETLQKGNFCAPWTCVNNCTTKNFPISEVERIKLRKAYKKRASNINARKKEVT